MTVYKVPQTAQSEAEQHLNESRLFKGPLKRRMQFLQAFWKHTAQENKTPEVPELAEQ